MLPKGVHPTEKVFSQQVVNRARSLGWLVFRVWNSIHSPAGWPDLTLARGETLLFRELKVGKGKLSPHQEEWRDHLMAAGADYAVWTPDDWEGIEETLT